jgi:hypothetical protein
MAVKMKTGRSATLYHTPQVHYLYRRFTFSDHEQSVSGAAKVPLGVLPDKCFPLETFIRVTTAFTGANLIVGTSVAGSSAAVVSTADVAAATSGAYVVDRYYGTAVSSDTAIYIQTKATGETVGQADVWQAYLPALPSTF